MKLRLTRSCSGLAVALSCWDTGGSSDITWQCSATWRRQRSWNYFAKLL